MKLRNSISIFGAAAMLLCSCSSNPNDGGTTSAKDSTATKDSVPAFFKQSAFNFVYDVQPSSLTFKKPALHSFAIGKWHNLWFFIGGQKTGFHGTSNNPPPFSSTMANDSMWVVDPNNMQTWGVPVPAQYANALMSTNPAYTQIGNFLYMCGGYTKSSSSATRFDMTSDYFFQIDMSQLVTYIKSGGTSPALNQVIPIAIESPYVQVTGGELFFAGNYMYLIGGQNYNAKYSAGKTGIYTNAIRRFTLAQSGGQYVISDTASVFDDNNLHRRDLNVVPVKTTAGYLNAVIYGGVFTPKDNAYMNPVYISNLGSGLPQIAVDTMHQYANEYACATIPQWIGQGNPSYIGFIGGISYTKYDAQQGKLVVGDNGMPLPFSNMASFMETDGIGYSGETIQYPPSGGSLLPAYIGANAAFIPFPQYLASGYEDYNLIDLKKVFPAPGRQQIGWMYGGILSMGPTSGTTPKGHVNTYANPVLYNVYLTLNAYDKKEAEKK